MPQLGVVADDFTGAIDIAGNLCDAGLSTTIITDLTAFTHGDADSVRDIAADAVVVALKTRTAPVEQAVADTLAAASRLRALGCDRLYFKYCSTFDSTPRGNIGPVTDALLELTDAPYTMMVPSFPDAGRTVHHARLSVNGVPLHDTSMRDHPLTPMLDDDLIRLLSPQTRHPVGAVPVEVVRDGRGAVREALESHARAGRRLIVVDAVTNDDLATIAHDTAGLPLVTGGSGLALGMATGAARPAPASAPDGVLQGKRAAIVGSASSASRRQIATATLALEVRDLPLTSDARTAELEHAQQTWRAHQPAIFTSVRTLDDVQQGASESVEAAAVALATALVEAGVTQLAIGGGETSGATVQGLGITRLDIGPRISTGVSWAFAQRDQAPLALALKSGNFGEGDFFVNCWEALR